MVHALPLESGEAECVCYHTKGLCFLFLLIIIIDSRRNRDSNVDGPPRELARLEESIGKLTISILQAR